MAKKQQEDYAAELQKSYERWAELYEHGGSDPFWEDGVNLNLVRNHIIYYRGKIEETMLLNDYPAVYFKELPPEVDQQYMARPDEIRAAARASLVKYMADDNYKYLLRHQDDFTLKTKKKLCIDVVIGYAEVLKRAITEDDLLTMRRHGNAESYLESFESCVRRMQETPVEDVQLDFFSSSFTGADEADNEDFEENEEEEFGGMTMN